MPESANGPLKLIPHDHGTIAALHELGDFAVSGPELAERIFRFLEVDAPIFRCKIDQITTKSTGHLVAIYEPRDRLSTFLVALRAGRGRDFHDPMEIASTHDVFSSAETVLPLVS
jgi:hypothetical protein